MVKCNIKIESYTPFIFITEEPVIRHTRRRSNVIQLPEEQAEALSKQQPDPSMTVSEKLLIESAAEIDRISEIKDPNNALPAGVETPAPPIPATIKQVSKFVHYYSMCSRSNLS